MHALLNGKLVHQEDISISHEDRGYHFGDGLYEVLRIYNGKMFMFNDHFQRLKTGAEKIHLPLPFSKEELEMQFKKLITENNILEGEVYFQISRGIVAPRQHLIPAKSETTPVYLAYTVPFERPYETQENGIAAALLEDMRWLHCDIKSLSLLGNVLSLDEAVRKGYDDAILHRNGTVTEASAANVWFVMDDILYTHPDGNLILPGITKKHILSLARENGLKVLEKAVQKDEIPTCSECFISNSLVEIVPVVSINGQAVGNGKRGNITKKLQELYIASIK